MTPSAAPPAAKAGAWPALTAAPGSPTASPPPPGVSPLRLGGRQDGLVYVPPGLDPAAPARLVVMFHGAGGTGQQGIDILRPVAERERFVVLAPDARESTWDLIGRGWGPDVEFVDRALRWVFDRVAIDERRIVAAGFSDGASYALSLGLTNGELFRRIVAFAPGLSSPAAEAGRPSIFVAHGTADSVLPIDRTSRRIVSRLRQKGYDVRYVEFTGGHSVPSEILEEGLAEPSVEGPAGARR